MSVFQDEQLQQLGTQLHEAEVQLMTMQASLKMMPPIVQVIKVVELKALQQRANKSRERHQHRAIELDQFHDLGEKLAMKDKHAIQVTN